MMQVTEVRKDGKVIEVSEEEERELLKLATGLSDEQLNVIEDIASGRPGDLVPVKSDSSRFSITADDLKDD